MAFSLPRLLSKLQSVITIDTANNNLVLANSLVFPDGTKQTTAGVAVDAFARTTANGANGLAQGAYNQANVTVGIDTTQNTLISIIQGVDLTQNTNITSVNQYAASAYALANASLGIDATQNTRIQSIETINTNQNTTIAVIQSVDLTQNTRLDGIEGTNLTQNTNITTANNAAWAAFSKANNALANTNGAIFNGELNITGTLRALTQGGDEGGEIYLGPAITNTTLSGGVTIDVYQNKLRIFEQGGSARGAYIDLTAAGAGVGTNILNPSATPDTTARALAQAAYNQANVTIGVDATQNTRLDGIEGTNVTQNTRINSIETINTNQNTSISIIEGVNLTQNTNITAVNQFAQSAYNTANTKFNSSGGNITGPVTISGNNDLTVTGNLYVAGTNFVSNTQSFNINDPLLVLGVGNYTSDLLDIGFAGHYNDGTNAHSGLIRDYGTKEYYFFKGYTPELDTNNNVNINHASFSTANVNASFFKGNLVANSVIVNGRDYQSVNDTQNTSIGIIQGVDLTQNTNITTANNAAWAAFATANTKFNSSGGTITGSVNITGNLTASTANLTGRLPSVYFSGTNSAVYYAGTDDNVTTWDLSTDRLAYTADTSPVGIAFKPDGTIMYTLGSVTGRVYQAPLSVAWNANTSVNTAAVLVNTQDTSPQDLAFSTDGTQMYVLGNANKRVFQYYLSTPWDINTASFIVNSNTASLQAQDTTVTGLTFKPDGSQMYVIGTANDAVYMYTLSTPWSVNTATFTSNTNNFAGIESTGNAVAFNNDGSKMWITGTQYRGINEFTLSTPWDVTTASYKVKRNVFSEENSPQALYYADAANTMYMLGATGRFVNQFSTNKTAAEVIAKNIVLSGNTISNGALFVTGNFKSDGTNYLPGTTSLGATAIAGALTASSTLSLTGAAAGTTSLSTAQTTGAINFGTALTTGAFIYGGTAQTSNTVFGRSTVTSNTEIANGIVASGSTKTLGLGNYGAAGSNTVINIGVGSSGNTVTNFGSNIVFTGALSTGITFADGTRQVSAASGTGSGGGGSSLASWNVVTSNYTVGNNIQLLANSAAGSFTITLPASPVLANVIVIADASGPNTGWSNNNVLVNPNGRTIQGIADTLALNISRSSVTLVYDGATWQVISTTGPKGDTGTAGPAGSAGAPGPAGAGANATQRNYRFNATNNQTIFVGADAYSQTLSYNVNALSVYLNGVFLRPTEDYFANNGTTITLTSGSFANDALDVITFQSMSLTAAQNTITTYTYTASNNQTSFGGTDINGLSLNYNPNNLFVTLNGLTLRNGTDYLQTNTAFIQLTSGALANDELSIVAFGSFNVQGQNTQNTISTYYYTSTAGQTNFTGSDIYGNSLSYMQDGLIVVRNGSTLRNKIDYTATNGTSVSLANPSYANDEIAITAFGNFSVAANGYTQVQSNNLFLTKTDANTIFATTANTYTQAQANTRFASTGKAIAMAIVFGG